VDVSDWDVSAVTTMDQMFSGSGFSDASYDLLLIGWDGNTVQSNVPFHAGSAEYSSGAAADGRDYLTESPRLWTITDGGPSEFVTVWETTASSETITLPATSSSNDFNVDWGDGNDEDVTSASPSHEYATAGEYTVTISGTCPKWYQNDGGDKLKIIEISNWGSVGFTELNNAFHGCENLTITAADPAGMGAVTTMYRMFFNCSSLTTVNASNWDVSAVTNMSYMFLGCSSLTTVNASNWDVSAVTTMERMFLNDSSLTTLDVSNWDVSAVTTMYRMFYECSSLTPLDVSDWDVSAVTTMYQMLRECSSLTTLDVSNWDVSAVTTMYRMFYNCSSLTTLDVSDWDVGAVTTMEYMFLGSGFSDASYDLLLIGWDGNTVQSNVAFHAGAAEYSSGAAADGRDYLTESPRLWTITDGGPA